MNPRIDVAVLKSPAFGVPGSGPLPYRADHLERLGFHLVWDDRRARLAGRRRPLVDRLEGLTTPFLQTWHLRAAIRTAPLTIAMFESEGHGLALARLVGWRRQALLVVVSCWLADLASSAGRARLALYRVLYRRVDVVTVFSANQVAILHDLLRIPESRIAVIPFGVDTSEVSIRETSRGGYVLAAGRDGARDWDTLFAAVAGTGVRLVVLARPRHLPTAPRPMEVDVRGYVERSEYLDLLAGCDAVVLTTRDAAYPSGQTVLLEALALGKPCIVSDTPAMRAFAGDLPLTWVGVGDSAAVRDAITNTDRSPVPHVPMERLDAATMWTALAAVVRQRLDGPDRGPSPSARLDRTDG